MRKRTQMQEIHSFDDVPEFTSEDDEAAFWSSHSLGREILDQMGPLSDNLVPTRERTRPVAVRFDADILRRLRVLAVKKHKGYQTLLKEFVVERLYEEEKREGIVGGRGD